MTILIHVANDHGYRTTTDLGEVPALLEDEKTNVWIDADERSEVLERFLHDCLELHGLVVEDIFSERLTPKVEDYGEYLYIVMHGVRRDAEDPESLGTVEADLVIGPNWVFTHHDLPMRSVEAVRDELARNPRALARGPAYLAHGVIDHLTDHYLPVMDRFDEEIDDLERDVVANPTPDLLQRLFGMKRSIQRLRRISMYQRDILQRLSRGEFERIPQSSLVFYRDVYDHFVRISDLAESYRELIGSGLEIYMSVTANRTNEIMKVLAIISTIMLPLTFIAGLYGMNFKHMPELDWRYGYPAALGLMAVVATLFVSWFRRRRWF
jgi:magnesium transporter